MGLVPKKKLEQLKREKREAKAAKKSKKEPRQMAVHFLIVCEGEKTEPNYFEALVKDKYSQIRKEVIKGEAKGTCALVKRAKKIVDEWRMIPFDRVWVVFDKDDFEDFNEAIALCKKYGFEAAWSNEAFELWYYLHFQYLDTPISRHDYIDRLEREIRRHDEYKDYMYKKHAPDFYKLLMKIGDEEQAMKRASRLRSNFRGNGDYSTHKPCTTVDLLVYELKHPQEVLDKINQSR